MTEIWTEPRMIRVRANGRSLFCKGIRFEEQSDLRMLDPLGLRVCNPSPERTVDGISLRRPPESFDLVFSDPRPKGKRRTITIHGLQLLRLLHAPAVFWSCRLHRPVMLLAWTWSAIQRNDDAICQVVEEGDGDPPVVLS